MQSIRVPALIERAVTVGGDTMRGLMCYSVSEAAYLYSTLPEPMADDILVAYPIAQHNDYLMAWDTLFRGCRLTLMVDSITHIESLAVIAARQNQLITGRPAGSEPVAFRVCIDLDMSYRVSLPQWLGGGNLLHLGVQRSPVRSVSDFAVLVKAIQSTPFVKLVGVMGYEAQIAGLPDSISRAFTSFGLTPSFSTQLNDFAMRCFKRISTHDVRNKRRSIDHYCKSNGIKLEFINGGGTGSLSTTTTESAVTEVTVGSGCGQSQLFDAYSAQSNPALRNEPALAIALAITRIPTPDQVFTCHSGGFIASGEINTNKQPQPFLPKGLEPISTEGFGEVQSPLKWSDHVMREFPDTKQSSDGGGRPVLSIGDPILVRPSKAGEIAERFNSYLVINERFEIVDRPKTYRGLGYSFY